MQPAAGGSDSLRQSRLDIHVHVFELGLEFELVRLHFPENSLEARDDCAGIGFRDDVLRPQHLRMRDGSEDVIRRQTVVERNALGESLHARIGPFLESSAPGFSGFSLLGLRNSLRHH